MRWGRIGEVVGVVFEVVVVVGKDWDMAVAGGGFNTVFVGHAALFFGSVGDAVGVAVDVERPYFAVFGEVFALSAEGFTESDAVDEGQDWNEFVISPDVAGG